MSNKDNSFTFSDKMKKSAKSVPLSKRIPSRLGADGKQRTLLQRAQRDLPFILVAAAALLLLPILSRDSSLDSPPSKGWDDVIHGGDDNNL
ncbi:MAG: hypothetical protein LBG46_02370, partial [Elusimicrobiota bacterium]|nr:hypothetical protein [Elusimicrobiota bacterium]